MSAGEGAAGGAREPAAREPAAIETGARVEIPPVAPMSPGPEKPGADKLPPEVLALRGRPARPIRFRRSVVIGGSAMLMTAVAAIAWLALGESGSAPVVGLENRDERGQAGQPDVLANAPASYDAVPPLGDPLPGDLGRPILARQRLDAAREYPPVDAEAADDPAAEARARAAAEELAARQSGVLMTLSGRTGAASLRPEPAESGRSGGSLGTVPGTGRQSADVSSHRLQPAASPYLISGGSILSASLVTAINSDVPGLVVAQLTDNAYDSITGRTLLIPQGARLIGTYESDTSYGQTRAQVVWRRIVWPNGASLRLDDLPATDAEGQSGLADRVDAHVGQLAKGVLLSTALGIGSEIGFGGGESDLARALRESLQQNSARAGEQAVGKALDIKPSIKVRAGWPLRIIVHSDLVLEPWRL